MNMIQRFATCAIIRARAGWEREGGGALGQGPPLDRNQTTRLLYEGIYFICIAILRLQYKLFKNNIIIICSHTIDTIIILTARQHDSLNLQRLKCNIQTRTRVRN